MSSTCDSTQSEWEIFRNRLMKITFSAWNDAIGGMTEKKFGLVKISKIGTTIEKHFLETSKQKKSGKININKHLWRL